MPNVWSGTIEERLERMSQAGRRCDANSRHCTRAAVEEYTLLPADGNFIALPDAEPVQKKCCGYHRQQFLNNGRWKVLASRELARKPDGIQRHGRAA